MFADIDVQHFFLSNVVAFPAPCSDVHCDFHIKTMFGSSLPPVVCRGFYVLFTLFVFAHSEHE